MVDKNEAMRELARRELARRQQQQQQAQPAYSGSILPFSKDQQGNVGFDSNAGILGAVKRSVMLPGEAMAGQIDPSSDEAIARSFEFASMFSPATPGMRSGDMAIPGESRSVRQATPAAPTADDLYAEAGRGFQAMRDSGVDYSSNAVRDMAETLKIKLMEDGFDEETATRTIRTLNKLATPPENSVANIRGLHSARKTFGKVAQDFNNPPDQSAATRAIRGLDEFIGNADEASVVAGTPSDAANALKTANANFSAAKRSDSLTGIERAGELRAAAANSGQNTGNSLRQRIASLILNPKASSGFNEAELAQLEQINRGTMTQNATRYMGNLLGGGGGLGAAVTGGVAGAGAAISTGNPMMSLLGVAAPVAGAVSKKVSNSLTQKALSAADDATRMRSPLYEQMAQNAPYEVIPQQRTAALIRALLLGNQPRQLGANEL